MYIKRVFKKGGAIYFKVLRRVGGNYYQLEVIHSTFMHPKKGWISKYILFPKDGLCRDYKLTRDEMMVELI